MRCDRVPTPALPLTMSCLLSASNHMVAFSASNSSLGQLVLGPLPYPWGLGDVGIAVKGREILGHGRKLLDGHSTPPSAHRHGWTRSRLEITPKLHRHGSGSQTVGRPSARASSRTGREAGGIAIDWRVFAAPALPSKTTFAAVVLSGTRSHRHRSLSAAWALRARLDRGLSAAFVASTHPGLVAIARAFVANRSARIVRRTWPSPRDFEDPLAGGVLAGLAHFEEPALGFHFSPWPNRNVANRRDRNSYGGVCVRSAVSRRIPALSR